MSELRELTLWEKIRLRFIRMQKVETDEVVTFYKKFKNKYYVFGIVRKPQKCPHCKSAEN